MMHSPREEPIVIGWKEFIDFPEWNIHAIKAKIDTGARTSALGVSSYELREADGAGIVAELRLALDRKQPERLTRIQTPVLKMVVVRNSSGIPEQRPLIETEIRIGQVRRRVRLTVANRARMRFRMILGRKALEGAFVVDVSRKYLLGRPSRR
jgi:hypothetical protein